MVKVATEPCLSGRKGSAENKLVPSRSGSTQRMSANVKVVVRVRPLNEREKGRQSRMAIDIVDDQMLVFDPKEENPAFFYQGVQQPNKSYLKRPNKELKFVFDHVCGQEASNQDVFEITTKEMLSSLMEGYNISVFVYGATGAGKTYTMTGNREHPGITYLTMEHLFQVISEFEKERVFDIGVSYIEVYNENVYDLIKPSKNSLQLREDNKYGVMVAGLTVNYIKTAQELLNMLENGNKNRTQHPTDANAESSRSHAVFQVYIKMSYKTSSEVHVVKLSMIDLAGSERASATGCIGERFKEGANINKSLLSLANCINKLADGSSFIPYRDSKLTRLLKDSLGGNCKTVMIANVSPALASYEDTYNTLKYAARASQIKQTVKKNIVGGDARISKYVQMHEELTKKVQELEAKLAQKDNESKQSTLAKINEELRKKNKELEIKMSVTNIKTEKDSGKTQELKRKINELETKLSLSSYRHTNKEIEWRQRIASHFASHSALEQQLAALCVQQRVLSVRRRQRDRALAWQHHLAHRSSADGIQQMCEEDIPRQERAAEKHNAQALQLEAKVMSAWTKWDLSRKKLDKLCNMALVDCPDIADYIKEINMESEIRLLKAQNELKHKLLLIGYEEINTLAECMSEMPDMLRILFFTLKGYDRVTPALTAQYLKIMKKIKSAKGITWSDDECAQSDAEFNFICNLDFERPIQDCLPSGNDANKTIDIVTDSDDFNDMENVEPVRLSARKRRGTPIKMQNNQTIVINDSLESIDTTKTINSAKKMKREFDVSFDVENCGLIQSQDLNSTFDMESKMEALKKSFQENSKPVQQPIRRELTDRMNTMNRVQRTISFNDKARIVKPVVGKAVPQLRRAVSARGAGPAGGRAGAGRAAGAGPAAGGVPRAGFGSTVARDGTTLQRNNLTARTNSIENFVGLKAVRGRQRMQTHPYTRPQLTSNRK